MSKLYGLFQDQEEAGAAIEALIAAGFEDANLHEIEDENINLETEMVPVAPIHQGGYGSPTALPTPSFMSDIDDSEARDFIHRSLRNGAALIVFEPDEEDYERAKRIMEDAGGQVFSN